MTFVYQRCGLCFPSEGRRDLRVTSILLPGSVHPEPGRGGLGQSVCVQAAGTCWTAHDLLHCDVTDAADGEGAWGSPLGT